ncbi:hypothetical protein O0I10_011820 [Lichtheimia ornata]|uniref:Uncharacterized protein n=1 Tax=Lichtheimia ornata TaxID=688661 RepID=A0AAD7USZ5_9FUNG|nr:uncharacterized protein O0I10_011820 [Lichtheimia ornata]KAJ8652561.1 hypothetical protein O0I10_011820 [Lichtheimia ornata]
MATISAPHYKRTLNAFKDSMKWLSNALMRSNASRLDRAEAMWKMRDIALLLSVLELEDFDLPQQLHHVEWFYRHLGQTFVQVILDRNQGNNPVFVRYSLCKRKRYGTNRKTVWVVAWERALRQRYPSFWTSYRKPSKNACYGIIKSRDL